MYRPPSLNAKSTANDPLTRVMGWPRTLTVTLVITLAYTAAALIGLQLIEQPSGIAVFWPAAGVSAAIILAFGKPVRGPVMVGAIAGSMVANHIHGYSLGPSVIFGIANAVECVLIAAICERYGRTKQLPFRIDDLHNVVVFILGTTAAALLAASFGAVFLTLTGHSTDQLLSTWSLYLRSDVIGVIAVAPFLIELLQGPAPEQRAANMTFEGTIGLAIVAPAAAMVFMLPPVHGPWAAILPEAVLFPILVWLAGRAPPVFTAAGALAATLCIKLSVSSGLGSYGQLDIPLEHRLAASQLAVLTLCFCSLSLTAMFAEQRRAALRQRRLVDELDHRVKNSLAVVLSMLDRSWQGKSEPGEAAKDLRNRIHSLARTHEILSQNAYTGADLRKLLELELAPFRTATNVTLEGADLPLSNEAAQSLSMVFHELCSNAVKYGALSVPNGHVRILWDIDASGVAPVLALRWDESGGPPLKTMPTANYGLNSIQSILSYELDAEISFDPTPFGLICTMTIPLLRLATMTPNGTPSSPQRPSA